VHRSAGRDESRPYNDPMHRGRRNDEHTSDNGESFCRDAIHRVHPGASAWQAGGRDESRPYNNPIHSPHIH
jgi:hypothetical protein